MASLEQGRGGRIFMVLLISLGFPLVFRSLMQADLSLLWLLAPALVSGLGIFRCLARVRRGWLTVASWAVTFLFGALVLTGILIIPYSVYRIWLDAVPSGEARGAVSDIFVLVTAFFTSAFAPTLLSGHYLWTLILSALILCSITALILQVPILFLGILLLILLCLVYLSRKGGRKSGTGNTGYALAVFFAVLLLAVLLAGRGQPQGSRLVDALLYPNLRKMILRLAPHFPLLYDIPGYGFELNEKKLGARPSLSPRPIFEVEAPPGRTFYLRTSVYDYYDGGSWTISEEHLRAGRPFPAEMLHLTRSMAFRDIRLQLLIDYYDRLPFTLDTTGIGFPRKFPKLEKGNLDAGYFLHPPLGLGAVMLLKRGSPPLASVLNPRLRALYLQIPPQLPYNVRLLAATLSSGATPQAVLSNIERYLASNYVYDLDPPREELEEDFVQSFLFGNRQGFCVHFATSFTMLARLNDIPTRYATGFLIHMPEESPRARVTGLAYHAWPEVWLEGRGWVTWEATGAVNPRYYSESEEEWRYQHEIDLDAVTARQIQSILGRRVGPEAGLETEVPEQGLVLSGRVRIFLVLCPIALLLLFGLLRLIPLGSRRARFLRKLRRMVKILRGKGVPSPAKLGWSSWAESLRRRWPQQGEEIERLKALLLRYFYGGVDTDALDLVGSLTQTLGPSRSGDAG